MCLGYETGQISSVVKLIPDNNYMLASAQSFLGLTTRTSIISDTHEVMFMNSWLESDVIHNVCDT